jgi:hypothetical protein
MNHENFKMFNDTCNNLSITNNTRTNQKGISKKTKLRIISKIIPLVFFIGFLLFSTTSCVVVSSKHHDSGKHTGWFKSSNHPHNSNPNNQSENNNSKDKHKKK